MLNDEVGNQIDTYTRQKRNAPRRTVQLSGRSQVIGQLR